MSEKHASLTASLKKYFGFEKFKGNQLAIIDSILDKKDKQNY